MLCKTCRLADDVAQAANNNKNFMNEEDSWKTRDIVVMLRSFCRKARCDGRNRS